MSSKKSSFTAGVSGIGFRYMIFALLVIILEYGIIILTGLLFPDLYSFIKDNSARATLALTVLTIYMIGFPVLALLLRRVPKMVIIRSRLRFRDFLFYVAATAGLALAGVIIGTPVHMALTFPFQDGTADTNDLASVMMSASLWERTLVVGILAPVFEELIFRKLLIDRTIRYGEFASILLSGLMFGLFHGNFQQFFFAALIGMLFAYVYIRTGNVIYTMLLHMAVNLSTSIVTTSLVVKIMPYLEEINELDAAAPDLQPEMIAALLLLILWLLLLLTIAVTGLILLIVFFKKKIKIYKGKDEPSRGKIFSGILKAPGFWGFSAVCIILFVINYLPS